VENPVGKRVTFDEGKNWTTIVGVVGDTTEYGPSQPVQDELYVPIDQSGFSGDLLVRTAMDPMSIAPIIRSAIHALDPLIAFDRINTITAFEQDSVTAPRVTTILLGLFAAVAVVISASGIAAVMALAVTERTHELGIRMALGAQRQSILRMIVGQGIALAAIGTALGIVGALALTRILSSLLYATSPTDLATFSAVSVLFLTIAAVACFLPARQVTAIEPVLALRQE
jgi:putative ABC transport system permease protein